MTLRVLAVDDERPALDDLARVLRAQPAVSDVATAESGEEAMHALAGGEHYDAVFLDVRMPGLDGVELARVLRRFASPPALIFVSAYESAAVEAFELRALDYLLKPVSRSRVAEALARVEQRPADAMETLAVDVPGGGTRLMRREDVLYLQSNYYSTDTERGFKYDDPDVGIEWPLKDPILSERDRNAPRLAEIADTLPW